MRSILQGHNFINEIQTITQVFYPNEKFIALTRAEAVEDEGLTAFSSLEGDACKSILYCGGKIIGENSLSFSGGTPAEQKKAVKRSMFLALQAATGHQPPWGLLTGIRPSKIVHELWGKGLTDNDIEKFMAAEYFIQPPKISLCMSVAAAERQILSRNNGKSFGLYIGIPFCPSKCLYCSFTSYPIEKYSKSLDAYLDALEMEMKAVSPYKESRVLESIYIGGGTPTSPDEKRFQRLLEMTAKYFGTDVAEYTVEAGRPDTITREKLRLMKEHGVTRISINPQTIHNKTLQAIGRAHSAEMFFDSFSQAREEGHGNINVDLILGLPGETPQDVSETIKTIANLQPENITLHTLAVKRASRLKEELAEHSLTQTLALEQMLKIVAQEMCERGYIPYYMYRQKNMLGNFENVGYCKPGFEGLYNIQIMEERQNIIALGAGATTKTVDLKTGRIQRIFNVKSVDDYIGRIDEMITRKGELL